MGPWSRSSRSPTIAARCAASVRSSAACSSQSCVSGPAHLLDLCGKRGIPRKLVDALDRECVRQRPQGRGRRRLREARPVPWPPRRATHRRRRRRHAVLLLAQLRQQRAHAAWVVHRRAQPATSTGRRSAGSLHGEARERGERGAPQAAARAGRRAPAAPHEGSRCAGHARCDGRLCVVRARQRAQGRAGARGRAQRGTCASLHQHAAQLYPPPRAVDYDSDDMDALRNGPPPAPRAAPAGDIESQVDAELAALRAPSREHVLALDTDTECCAYRRLTQCASSRAPRRPTRRASCGACSKRPQTAVRRAAALCSDSRLCARCATQTPSRSVPRRRARCAPPFRRTGH